MKRFCEIKHILLLELAVKFDKAGLWSDASKKYMAAARVTLEDAVDQAKLGDYSETLKLYDLTAKILKEADVLGKDGWWEIHLARAICYSRLGQVRMARKSFEKARKLEQTDQIIREIGIRLGFESA